MADIDAKKRASRRSKWLLVVAAGLIVLGGGLFVAVAYLPAQLSTSLEVRATVALTLRLMGFAAILGAGWALLARSSR